MQHNTAPKKFMKVYTLLCAGSFLYKFNKKAINSIITPVEAKKSDNFIVSISFQITPATLTISHQAYLLVVVLSLLFRLIVRGLNYQSLT